MTSIAFRCATALAVGALCSSCAPRESYVEPAGQFAKSAEQLSKIAATELAGFTTDRRADWFRGDLRFWIEDTYDRRHSDGGRPEFSMDALQTYLCVARAQAFRAASAKDYLTTLAESLRQTSNEPPEEFSDLVLALGANYSITAIYEEDATEVLSSCDEDLKSYIATIYPEVGQRESVGAAIVGVEQLYQLLAKMTTGILREVDSAKRAAALRDFFSDEQKRNQLAQAVDRVSGLLKDASTRRRHLAVKVVVETYADVSRASAMASPATESACEATLSSDEEPSIQNAAFQSCYKAVWSKLAPPLQAFLSAAAAYDIEANKLPNAALADIRSSIENLQNIADGKIDEKLALHILRAAIRVAKLAIDTEKSLTSDETKKQVEDAVRRISDAL